MTRRLIITWQDGDSRQHIPVAELVVTTTDKGVRYEFGYVEDVLRARKLSFQPFAAFPEIDRRYTSSELFPFFRNRVMPTTRPDYLDYVTALGLSIDTANAVDLLGRSQGRRHTDRIETVLAAERDAAGAYVTHFLARGVRHVQGAEEVVGELQPGRALEAVLEATNERNPRARQLQFQGKPVGYLSDYLVSDIDVLEAASASPSFTVVRVNPSPAPSHHRLLVRLNAAWPAGFEPFAAPAFRPVARVETALMP